MAIEQFTPVPGNGGFALDPCPICGHPSALYERTVGDNVHKFVACDNNSEIVKGKIEFCPLHIPPEDFMQPTKKEAVTLWQAFVAAHLASVKTLQDKVAPWMQECFGPVIAADKDERNFRFFEEGVELVQAGGMTREDAHRLVDYVYDRPIGQQYQEVGGVMITLAAWCLAHGLNMHWCGQVEMDRILQPEVMAKIREKQKNKPHGSPLPGEFKGI